MKATKIPQRYGLALQRASYRLIRVLRYGRYHNYDIAWSDSFRLSRAAWTPEQSRKYAQYKRLDHMLTIASMDSTCRSALRTLSHMAIVNNVHASDDAKCNIARQLEAEAIIASA